MERKIVYHRRKLKAQTIFAIFICVLAVAGFLLKNPGGNLFSQETALHPDVTDNRNQKQARKEFDEQLKKIFKEEVTDDSLTLNYTLKHPEKYGISEKEPTLGTFSLESLKEGLMVSENRLAMLRTFDFEKLTEEQKLLYDIIYQTSEQNLKAADFLEYSEVLSPSSGIQAQLPVFFAEYHFYQKKDVELYLSLLEKIPEYFEDILVFEKEKSQKGLFMSDTTVQEVIRQCEEFTKEPEKNYMIAVFQNMLQKLDGLSEKEKKEYMKKNRKAVLEYVIPAYQNLVRGLKELKGSGKNGGGLCHFEKGKKYYEYLAQTKTGSERSIKQMILLLDEKMSEYKKEMSGLMTKEPSAYYEAQSVQYKYNTPKKALKHLKKCTEKDFPQITEEAGPSKETGKDGRSGSAGEISYEIKKVDASLEDSMSPAFYLTPAVDDYTNNVIYINESERYDLSKAFTTLAHEGYPGHLYQHCYFRSKSPNPLRCVIHVGGYTEGWGVYSEIYSYDHAGLKKDVAKLLKLNTLLTLCVYAKTDIGIHHEGWTYKETQKFLADYGFGKKSAKTIFDSIVAAPADYLQYTIGYLEIQGLEERAKKELGKKFKQKAFYDFFLSIGPAPFSVIEDRMKTWMESM